MEQFVSVDGNPIIINLVSDDFSDMSGEKKRKLKKVAGYIPHVAAYRAIKKGVDKRREKKRNG